MLNLKCDLKSEEKSLNSCAIFKVSGMFNGELCIVLHFFHVNDKSRNSNLLSEAIMVTMVKVDSTLSQTLSHISLKAGLHLITL